MTNQEVRHKASTRDWGELLDEMWLMGWDIEGGRVYDARGPRGEELPRHYDAEKCTREGWARMQNALIYTPNDTAAFDIDNGSDRAKRNYKLAQ